MTMPITIDGVPASPEQVSAVREVFDALGLTKVGGKIKTLSGSNYVADAADIEETENRKFFTAAQSIALAALSGGLVLSIDTSSGYLFKFTAGGYEVATIDLALILRVAGRIIPRLATTSEVLAGLATDASVSAKDLATLLASRLDVTSRPGTSSGELLAFTDPALGRLAWVDIFGVLRVLERVVATIATPSEVSAGVSTTSAVSVAQALQIVNSRVLFDSNTSSGYLLKVVDSAGYLMFGIDIFGSVYPPSGSSATTSEVATARGTKPSLSAYLLTRNRVDGLPSAFDQPLFNSSALRETRRILRQLKEGAANTQFAAWLEGDSWSDNSGYWMNELVKSLVNEWGDAGPGYVSFVANISGTGGHSQLLANFTLASVSLLGAWTRILYTPTGNVSIPMPSPDLSQISSSTAGDKITLTVGGGLSGLSLFHRGGNGSVRYRYNGGAWTALDLTGVSTLETKDLAVPPAGALTVEIEVVSGLCEIYGAHCIRAANGIRWTKAAMFGTRSDHHVAAVAADWQRGFAKVAPNLAVLFLNTNDRYTLTPTQVKGYKSTWIDRVRVARPTCDILLVSAPENLAQGVSTAMADYAFIDRALAAERGCAHLDLQPAFGSTTSQYDDSPTGTGYFTTNDANARIHPSIPQGGAVVGEAFRRAIF